MFFACSNGPLIQNHVWTKIIGTAQGCGAILAQCFSCTSRLSPHVLLHCFPQKTRVGFTLTTNFTISNHHWKPNQKPKKDLNTSLLSHTHMRTYTIHRPDTVSVNLSLQPGNTQHMSQGPSVQLLFEQAGRPV